MSKKSIATGIAAVLIAVTAAYAANVHFKRQPTFSDQGTRLQACLSLAGLGNQDVTITIRAEGLATTLCTNRGGNQAPGQNRNPVHPTAQQTFPSTQIKNGNLSVCLTTSPPPTPSPTEAGCPNANWTTTLTDVEFSTVEIVVEQGGQIVLDQTFEL